MLGGARARYRTTHCSLYCADLADLFYLHAGTRVMAHVEQEEEKSLERWKIDPVCVVPTCPFGSRGLPYCVHASSDSRVVASDRTRTCNFGTTVRSRCFRARPLPAPGFCPCHGSSRMRTTSTTP